MNAGCRTWEAHDGVEPIPVLELYPAAAAETPQTFGPYTIRAARDAAPAPVHPVVIVISHGTGGTPYVYRDLAAHLARHGFRVLLPEHPRNNRRDNSLGGTAAILAHRPRHVTAVLNAAQVRRAAIIGHSLGGYTALALAGGKPTCFANESPDGVARPVSVTPDPRVERLVLLAPAAVWFLAPGALASVRLPVLMLTAGNDPHTPAGHGEIVKAGLVHAGVHHRVIPNAGHFSFLSPFPPHMVTPAFAPAHDPPGFDRAAFLGELQHEVLAFLAHTTAPSAEGNQPETGAPTAVGSTPTPAP